MPALDLVERNRFVIAPLPKKSVGRMAELIEKSSRNFNPYKEIHHRQMREVVRRYKKEFNKLNGYYFDYIYNEDQGVINYEIMADFGFKVKLYLLSDSFKSGTQATVFMKRFNVLIQDINEQIIKWNELVRRHDITFYSRPPIEHIKDSFNQKLYDTLMLNQNHYLSNFDAMQAIRCFDELRFGDDREWSLSVFSDGTLDWGRNQYILRHLGIRMSFLVEEIAAPLYGRTHFQKVASTHEYAIARMMAGLVQWNKRGGNINEKPINLG